MIGQVVPADSQNTTGSYICSWIPTTIVLEQSHPAVGCSCSNTELPGKTCYHMNVLRVTNCFLIEETLQEGMHICLHHRTGEKPVRGHMLYWRI